jgi:hypothetical protein
MLAKWLAHKAFPFCHFLDRWQNGQELTSYLWLRHRAALGRNQMQNAKCKMQNGLCGGAMANAEISALVNVIPGVGCAERRKVGAPKETAAGAKESLHAAKKSRSSFTDRWPSAKVVGEPPRSRIGKEERCQEPADKTRWDGLPGPSGRPGKAVPLEFCPLALNP